MATAAPITIPQGLDLCGSIVDQQLFVQLVNQNFELLVKMMKDVQNVTVTLPGVPGFDFASPGITIPGFGDTLFSRTSTRPALSDGWVGGRFPFSSPEGEARTVSKFPGMESLQVGGMDTSVAGVDPYTLVMQLINLNFQLLVKSNPTLLNLVVDTPVFVASPCAKKKPPKPPPQQTLPPPTSVGGIDVGGALGPDAGQALIELMIQNLNEQFALAVAATQKSTSCGFSLTCFTQIESGNAGGFGSIVQIGANAWSITVDNSGGFSAAWVEDAFCAAVVPHQPVLTNPPSAFLVATNPNLAMCLCVQDINTVMKATYHVKIDALHGDAAHTSSVQGRIYAVGLSSDGLTYEQASYDPTTSVGPTIVADILAAGGEADVSQTYGTPPTLAPGSTFLGYLWFSEATVQNTSVPAVQSGLTATVSNTAFGPA